MRAGLRLMRVFEEGMVMKEIMEKEKLLRGALNKASVSDKC